MRLGSGFVALLLPRLLPSDWLHRRQMIWALSGWSVPPLDAGVMWSTSALFGRRLLYQSSGVLHVWFLWWWQMPVQGHRVMCLSRCLTVRTVLFQRAVPVRDVAMPPPDVLTGAACSPAGRGRLWVMSQLPLQHVPAGWYPDPAGSQRLRWWDGCVWAEHYQPLPTQAARSAGAGLVCPRCRGQNVVVQAVTESRTVHRGCFGWMMWILLAVITFGLILIIPLLTNSKVKSSTRFVAICQQCGNRWRV